MSAAGEEYFRRPRRSACGRIRTRWDSGCTCRRKAPIPARDVEIVGVVGGIHENIVGKAGVALSLVLGKLLAGVL